MRHPLAILCLAALPVLALANEPPTSPAAGAAPNHGSAASAPPASTGDTRAGTLRAVRGSVQLTSEGSPSRAARAGDAVQRSQQIVTAADGAASVMLRDGTALVVGPSSRLELKDFRFDSTTQQGDMWVSLLRGSLRMVTGLIGMRQPSAVQVQARTVTVGIRGTDFIVALEEE